LFCTAAAETQGNTDPSIRLDRQMPNSAYSERTYGISSNKIKTHH
jgi:hypothetical protein